MGEAGVDDLIARLASEDRATQRLACEDAAHRLEEEPGFHRDLVRLLDQGPVRGRFAAAFVLYRTGRGSLRLLPALLDALDLPDGDLRWSAAAVLAALGRMHGEVLPVLLHEARTSRSGSRRRMALYALRDLAPEREETREVMLRALDDRDPEVRRAALSSFAKLADPGPTSAERVLTILADDPDPRMRRIAAVVAPGVVQGHPGARARALDLLGHATRHADAGLSRAAESALARLQTRPDPSSST